MKKYKAIENILYYILLFFGLSLLSGLLSFLINKSLPNYEYSNSLLLNLSNIIVYVGVSGFLFARNYDDIINSFKKFNIYSIPKIIIGFVLIFLTSMLVSLLFSGQTNNQSTINMMYEKKSLLIIHAVILAPLAEEIVFRKSIRDLIKNPIVYLIVSSLFFGLFHCLSGDFENIIKYALPGLMFSIIYLNEENIGLSYIIHLLYNLVVILLA